MGRKSYLDQGDLFAELRVAAQFDYVDLVDLPDDAALMADLSPQLRDHVLENGVLFPISVVQNAPGPLTLVDGRRRVLAARLAELDSVPALIFPAGTPLDDMTIIANSLRSENAATDMQALATLFESTSAKLRESIPDDLERTAEVERALSKRVGMPIQTLRKRLWLLGNLHETLRHALEHGEIKAGIAEAAAKLSRDKQAVLVSIFEATGKLTAKDIREIRTAHALNATDPLGDLFGDEADDDLPQARWRGQVGGLLRTALEFVPTSEAALRAQLRALLADVTGIELRAVTPPSTALVPSFGGSTWLAEVEAADPPYGPPETTAMEPHSVRGVDDPVGGTLVFTRDRDESANGGRFVLASTAALPMRLLPAPAGTDSAIRYAQATESTGASQEYTVGTLDPLPPVAVVDNVSGPESPDSAGGAVSTPPVPDPSVLSNLTGMGRAYKPCPTCGRSYTTKDYSKHVARCTGKQKSAD